MLFQYVSDVHLEHRAVRLRDVVDDVGADALCLCGDIGDVFSREYASFMRECAVGYAYVFVILGNHEFYGHRFERTIRGARNVCARISPRLVVLHDAFFDIPHTDIRVSGATLWSHMESPAPIADFTRIRGWTVEENNRAHRKAVRVLRRSLDHSRKHHVVLTHHSPLVNAPGFGTDVTCVVKRASRWVFGHTHVSSAVRVGDCEVCANQVGYPDERHTGHDPLACFCVPNRMPNARE